MNISIPEYIKNLKPYKSGNSLDKKTSREEFKALVNLASNENPLGASPMALDAIKSALADVAIYPDPSGRETVEALATKLDISPDRIVFGSGSDSLIAYIVNAFSDVNDEVLTASGTFIGTFVNVNKLGRKLVTVPLQNYGFDLPSIANSITTKTKIIYLANPNNPTGTMFTTTEFEQFMTNVPDNVLVILDEAYDAYSKDTPDYPDGLKYDYQNLIVLRTFSKSYGLAGIRVGFAVSNPEIISYLYRVKLPFEPNVLAQKAAIGAISDDDFLYVTKEMNKVELQRLCEKFESLNVEYVKPYGNFVMILLANEAEAKAFVDFCLAKGFVTRPLPMFGIPNGVRINTGTPAQMDKALEVFEEAIKTIRKK